MKGWFFFVIGTTEPSGYDPVTGGVVRYYPWGPPAGLAGVDFNECLDPENRPARLIGWVGPYPTEAIAWAQGEMDAAAQIAPLDQTAFVRCPPPE